MAEKLVEASTNDGAWMDVAANGARVERVPPIKVIAIIHNKKHKREQSHHYFQIIGDIKHSSFSPLVFSFVGGTAQKAIIFYNHFTSLSAEK